MYCCCQTQLAAAGTALRTGGQSEPARIALAGGVSILTQVKEDAAVHLDEPGKMLTWYT
jgi:hypothetical protein